MAQSVFNWVLVFANLVLVGVTLFYAIQTKRLADLNGRLVDLTNEILKQESLRWLMETRPFVEIRFAGWGNNETGPEFQVINIGKWPAVRARFDGSDIEWVDPHLSTQGFCTIGGSGDSPMNFHFVRPPVGTPGKTLQEMEWSSEFRIRYNDVGGFREFADKWKFGVNKGKPFLLKVNITELQTTPPLSEDYVIQQGPE